MKFIPLYGRHSLERSFCGKHWNPKYLRAIQNVLNVTKGIIMPGKLFFEKAYGKTLEEFHGIMIMPEAYIFHRFRSEKNGRKDKWLSQYLNFNKSELEECNKIIYSNEFHNLTGVKNHAIIDFIREHYQFKYKR